MLCRDNQLNPLQRRSGVLFGLSLILTMVTFVASHLAAEHDAITRPLLRLIELLPALPVGVMIFIVGRYLARETDEFVRKLITQSLLWGFGVTMIGDIVFGVLFEDTAAHSLSQIYNIDVFCITAIVALTIQLRRAQ